VTLGDLSSWAKRFIAADERLLERIAHVWPACLSILPSQPEEDEITINLVHLLSKDPIVRRVCHWVEYQFEPFGTTPSGAKFSKGKIDIAVLLDWERERYIAYECKRLNVVSGGRRVSLAMLYVKEGMMRFMIEKYAEALPVGCMLGYVLDGDIAFALRQVTRAITSYRPLSLLTGPTAIPTTMSIERFLTAHTRSAHKTIQLRHALIGFPCTAP
jgi:hypothetical protein